MRQGLYTMDFASSGKAALEILDSDEGEEIILLVSDINMLGMTGFELPPVVKAWRPDLPVFMISAYGDPATVASALARGADKFLSKPVGFPQLKLDITEMISPTLPSRNRPNIPTSTAQHPLQHINHRPLADEQQKDDDAQHRLDPRQPCIGLLPSLVADDLGPAICRPPSSVPSICVLAHTCSVVRNVLVGRKVPQAVADVKKPRLMAHKFASTRNTYRITHSRPAQEVFGGVQLRSDRNHCPVTLAAGALPALRRLRRPSDRG